MRMRLVGWLRRCADWLEGRAPSDVIVRARVLVREQYGVAGRSGEAKRHQVYAALIKHFPAHDHRQLSRAVEDALDLEEPR